MFQDITLDKLRELMSGELQLIDVRSPSEYRESTIPGSVNIPFFDDEERAEIGTLYKQTSIQAAKERGLEIASAKLPALVKEFAGIEKKKAVFCWRGGMRSRTTATVLSLMGIHCYRLIGGFRAYRKWVVETLERFEMQPSAVVIHGNTGTGKTALLRMLQEAGQPVLDLEGMADHAGSIFGQIGRTGHNQKTFDSLLLEELLRLQHSPYVIFEAESKRIGKVVVPEFLSRKKEEGTAVWLEMPVDARVRHLLEDYRPWERQEEYLEAFRRIKSRIHTPIAAGIERSIQEGQFETAIRLVLEHYYDPRYEHTAQQYEQQGAVVLRVNSVEEAFEAVQNVLSARV